MNLHGSIISFPIRFDARGTFATTDRRETVISEAIEDVLETRRGERVMMPDYGIPDFAFSVQDSSFVHRLAYLLERQIKAYVPLVRSVKVDAAKDEEGRIVLQLRWQEVGSINAPGNMVYPVWRLRNGVAR
jgi:phage baseplate assembly protein W